MSRTCSVVAFQSVRVLHRVNFTKIHDEAFQLLTIGCESGSSTQLLVKFTFTNEMFDLTLEFVHLL